MYTCFHPIAFITDFKVKVAPQNTENLQDSAGYDSINGLSAIWEAEARGSLEPKSFRLAWAIQ